MSTNGEAIYATRARDRFEEGGLRFTRSKNADTVYAIALEWPNETLRLRTIRPTDDTVVSLLGEAQPLEWSAEGDEVHVVVPQSLKDVSRHAWVFRFEHVAR